MIRKENKLSKLKDPGFSSTDLLKDIAYNVGGKNGPLIFDLLQGKKHVNEFLIAKKLDLTINQTRNILYKLSDEGLVSSVRKKDKKKGWYTYFWTVSVDKALILSKKIIIDNIERLEQELNSRQEKRFYRCKVCGTEIAEEDALAYDFTCSECGEIYELGDSKDIINEIISNLNRLKKKLTAIEYGLEIIETKRIKNLEAEKRKIEKEKIAKRISKKKVNLVKKPKKIIKNLKKIPKPKKEIVKKKIVKKFRKTKNKFKSNKRVIKIYKKIRKPNVKNKVLKKFNKVVKKKTKKKKKRS